MSPFTVRTTTVSRVVIVCIEEVGRVRPLLALDRSITTRRTAGLVVVLQCLIIIPCRVFVDAGIAVIAHKGVFFFFPHFLAAPSQ